MKPTIGIVLSSVPGYSETFFRNKIEGLQNNGVEVILFVDYLKSSNLKFPCKVVPALNLTGNPFKIVVCCLSTILKSIFVHPKRSYNLFTLNKKSGLSLKQCVKNNIINEFLLSRKLDWIHFGYGMLAVNREHIAEAIGAKMAVSFRGFDLYLSPLKHNNCYKQLFLQKATYHVLSQKMKDILVDKGVQKKHVHIITPAINVEDFKPVNITNEDSVVNILTVARLHWIKGLEYTLEALADLKRQGVRFKYTLIGSGGERERLLFAAHQLGISNDIIFTGKLSHKAVKNSMEKTDIYLQYSIQEGFCNAVLEAQAMGLLCVVSDADGLRENVIHGETGWVVPKRQPELLAEQIKKIIDLSQDTKQVIRNQAIFRVQQHFNLVIQQKAFLNFYGLNLKK